MIREYFSTPIFETLIKVDNFSLVNFCYEKSKEPGVIKSNINGFQSDLLDFKEPILQNLTMNILSNCVEITSYYNAKKELNAMLQSIWININPKGGSNAPHHHPASYVSGVYYVKTPQNCGRLVLEHPAINYDYHNNKHTISEYNDKNAARLFITPQAGKLVLFPSWARHYVEPNASNDDRISLAFNVGFD